MFEIIILLAWIFPILVIICMIYGYLRYKLMFKTTNNIKKIIIQITTIGNHNIVNKIISSLRSYNLKMPYEIWIITESDELNKYVGADHVIMVPKDFVSISKYKARALDYSAEIRKFNNLIGDDIKILYLDDDSLPSKLYIEKCFVGDYDIMEGITVPKLNYGSHFSYIENMRVISCMSVCSVFQSHGHPVWVHGEGMCVRASTEQKVRWKFDAIASEDLIFGHKSSENKLKWGFIWEQIYITSPWNFADFLKQRNRWFWGNVHAINNLLSPKSSGRMIIFYTIGILSFVLSSLGIIMDIFGMLSLSPLDRLKIWIAFIGFLSIHGYVGYVVGEKKLKHIVISVVLSWYVSFMNILPFVTSLIIGKPKKFEVIEKEKPR